MTNFRLPSLALVCLATACGGVTKNDNTDAAAAADSAPDIDAQAIDAPISGFTVTGPITSVVPDNSVAIVVWSNTGSSPDSIHKYGEGTTSGGTFTVTMPEVIPNSALNLDELGVGIVVVYPAGTVIADGILDDSTLDTMIGASPDHAIIFRHSGELGTPWETMFPTESFGCGVCVPQVGAFDEFTPVQCTTVEVDAGDLSSLNFCNWT